MEGPTHRKHEDYSKTKDGHGSNPNGIASGSIKKGKRDYEKIDGTEYMAYTAERFRKPQKGLQIIQDNLTQKL